MTSLSYSPRPALSCRGNRDGGIWVSLRAMRGLSHRQFRRAISRFIDGELDDGTTQPLAAHIRKCDRCRRDLELQRAIKGALQRLADTEPPNLAVSRLRRWAASLQRSRPVVAPEPRKGEQLELRTTSNGSGSAWTAARPASRNSVPTRVGVLAAVVAGLAATGALLPHRRNPPSDPGAVAALVEIAQLGPPTSPAAPNAEHIGQHPGRMLELGDRQVWLARQFIDGREVLVATSERAFPMPADARPLGEEPHAPWLARRGVIGLACLSRPTHRLLVGPLPADRLLEIGRRL